MSTKRNEFKLAIEIAKSRETPLIIMMHGGILAFKYVREVDEREDSLIGIRGLLQSPSTEILERELDHKVTLDLDQILAVIIRDRTSLDYSS